ncbi:MAG: PAS domain S-box protein [bacterium]
MVFTRLLKIINEYKKRIFPLRITTYLTIITAFIFTLSSISIVLLVNYHMRSQALTEAQAKAEIILDRTLAVHDYFFHDLKPNAFTIGEKYVPVEYFNPTWMSSTYANRRIDDYFKARNSDNLYFKNCAINARSPKNEADDYERTFINELNINPELMSRSTIRKFNGEPYLTILKRSFSISEPCLKCHSTPEIAPQGLIDIFGIQRGFNRRLGESVSAVSIRIPLYTAYAMADCFSLKLSGILLLIILGFFILQYVTVRQCVCAPIRRIHDKAIQIAEEGTHLGEEVSGLQSRELNELAQSFNLMSRNLRRNRDHLEALVTKRTKELRAINEQLQRNILKHEQTEKSLQENEASLKRAQQLAHVGSWEWNLKDNSFTMSDEMCRILGISCTHNTFDTFQSLIDTLLHPDDREMVIHAALGVTKKFTGTPLTYRIIRPSGETRWIIATEPQIRHLGNDGTPEIMIGAIQDITEKKIAEDLLQQSEYNLRTIFDTVHAGIVMIDANTHKIINANPKALEMCGVPKGKLLGSVCHNYICPDEKVRCPITDLGETVNKSECTLLTASGEKIPILKTVTKVELEGQKCLIENFIDITDRKEWEKKITESEQKFRAIFDNATDGILIADSGTKKFDMGNNTICQMLGYTLEEIKTLGIMDIHPEEALPYIIEQFEKQAKGELKLATDIAVKRKDGGVFYADVNSTLVSFSGGKYLLGVFRDITERRRAENELRQQRNEAQNYLDIAGVMLVNIDADQRVTLINKNGCEILGYKKEEILNKNWFDHFLPEKRRDKVKTVFNKLIAGNIEPAEYFENPVLTKNGEERMIRWHYSVLRDETGEITAILSSGEDITDRKKVEEELKRVHSAVETSLNAIFIADLEGTITYANPSAARMWGFNDYEEMYEKNVLEYWTEESRGKAKEIINIITNEGSYSGEGLVGRKKDGTELLVSLKASLLTDDNGKPIGMTGCFSDITATKEYEEQLKQAKEKAEESDCLKSAFLANVSHEIRTPLNPILGYTELMLSDELSEDHREYLHTIKKSVNLLLFILNDILDLSKIEAGQLEIELIPCSLKSILHNIDSHCSMLISQEGKDISLRQSCPDTISRFIMGDPTRIQQIMHNLMSNAIKFTESGSIEYGVSLKNKKTLEFYVSDTGVGIPKDKQKEIFRPFHQADVSHTRKHGGTGLGLTICKKLSELMGGKIRLTSRTGADHGTTFYFTLPYTPTEIEEPHNASHTKIPIETKTPYTILIAEDNISNQQITKKVLEKSGYNVVVSNDGQEAISLYKSNPSIDLILMDVQMPVLDGLDATKAIRTMEAEAKKGDRISIIALTAYAMKGDRERCLEAGMDDYVSKPIRAPELLAAIENKLGRSREKNEE